MCLGIRLARRFEYEVLRDGAILGAEDDGRRFIFLTLDPGLGGEIHRSRGPADLGQPNHPTTPETERRRAP